MRITADFDEDQSRKLQFLSQTTELELSEVLGVAIDAYYDRVRREKPSAAEILTATGFIGSGTGDPNLSENYKEELAKLFAESI
jgi:hypothetical protein